jgi:hypothetical protein
MVRYFNECRWLDVGDGLMFQFTDSDGNVLSQITLMNSDGQLWKFEVMLPDRYKANGGANPAAIVTTQSSARRIAEMILLSTIVTR